nr:LacI family DNA-binding transcriptional regulator [uncultured Dethiosulfovibrio sp.]
MSKITMSDVALEAQVNKATVSRALKGDPRISPITREKVWEAAKRLGYRIDTVAQGLSSKKTSLVGVVIGNLKAPWAGAFLSGVERVLSRYRMEMIVKEADGVHSSGEAVFQRLADRKVEGIIWNAHVPFLTALEVPLVTVGEGSQVFSMKVVHDVKAVSESVLSLAGMRSIRYFSGDSPLFKYLSDLERDGEGELSIYDGVMPPLSCDVRDILLCSDPVLSGETGCTCLDWSVFDAGGVGARCIVNLVRGKGVRPKEVYLSPSLYSSGERVSR